MINFINKQKKVPFIKGVIYGDAGSGKTTFAASFIKKSCEFRNSNNCILIDTEKGWDWILTRELSNINVLQPELALDPTNYHKLFDALDKYVLENNVACVVVDSISKIGELIGEKTLNIVNQEQIRKGKSKKEDLSYADWGIFREHENIVINILRNLQCDVVLCGRSTSEYTQNEEKKILQASERSVQGFKKITYEFDFSILSNVDFDITKNNIKTFTYLNVKNRIANDGEKTTDINNMVDEWFALTQPIEFNKQEIIQTIAKQTTTEELNEYYKFLTSIHDKQKVQQVVEYFTAKKQELTSTNK